MTIFDRTEMGGWGRVGREVAGQARWGCHHPQLADLYKDSVLPAQPLYVEPATCPLRAAGADEGSPGVDTAMGRLPQPAPGARWVAGPHTTSPEAQQRGCGSGRELACLSGSVRGGCSLQPQGKAGDRPGTGLGPAEWRWLRVRARTITSQAPSEQVGWFPERP